MKKNTNITEINKITRNTDKQLMQMLLADLNSFRSKGQGVSPARRNQQAA